MEVTQSLDHVTHAVIGGGKTIDFGISDSAEFFHILSASLYTNERYAMIREVLCNAWDAHIDAGCTDKPIEIMLDEGWLTIRDFGKGIPHDQIKPIYGIYGGTTKREDEKSTGGFGLGCKAPFAYTDHFEVISHHGGTRTIYNMSKSSATARGKPGIHPLASFPTTETGLRVRVPIQSKDRRDFIKMIRLVVANGEMLATLNNNLLDVLPFSKAEHGFLITSKNLTLEDDQKGVFVKYGAVVYPIPNSSEYEDLHQKVKAVLSELDTRNFRNDYSVVLLAPPNSISVPPSRETISLREHTVNTVKRLMSKFLKYGGNLNNVVLQKARTYTDKTIEKRDYCCLFRDSWPFDSSVYSEEIPIVLNIDQMATLRMRRDYLSNIADRLADVRYRVAAGADKGLFDKHLAKSYIKDLEGCITGFNRYARKQIGKKSQWLQREILAKIIGKANRKGLDPKGLHVLDSSQQYVTGTSIYKLHEVSGRHPLINLPFLRKVIVVTTAMTTVRDRLCRYSNKFPEFPYDDLLCYYVKQRKEENINRALEFFKELGYEVIDLTKPFPGEIIPKKSARVVTKRPEGLPALSELLKPSGLVDLQRFRKDTVYRNPNPELVMVIPARLSDESALPDFSPAATRQIIKLYGDRVGIAENKTEMARHLKQGAQSFLEVLDKEVTAVMTTSPGIQEYLAYALYRVRSHYAWGSEQDAAKLVYNTPELRNHFGLLRNMTAEEEAVLKIYRGMQHEVIDPGKAIEAHIDGIPMATENDTVRNCIRHNDLLSILNLIKLESGLGSPKRQVYIDLLIKALEN